MNIHINRWLNTLINCWVVVELESNGIAIRVEGSLKRSPEAEGWFYLVGPICWASLAFRVENVESLRMPETDAGYPVFKINT